MVRVSVSRIVSADPKIADLHKPDENTVVVKMRCNIKNSLELAKNG